MPLTGVAVDQCRLGWSGQCSAVDVDQCSAVEVALLLLQLQLKAVAGD
jgi:hypothetical protein